MHRKLEESPIAGPRTHVQPGVSPFPSRIEWCSESLDHVASIFC